MEVRDFFRAERVEARYLGFAGVSGHRTLLYIVRKYLGFSVSDWRSLSWWEQRLYLEGLEADGKIQFIAPGIEGDAIQDQRVYTEGSATITERDLSYNLDDEFGLPEGGFTVGTLG